jgi:SSS family solute:Na+ symporter
VPFGEVKDMHTLDFLVLIAYFAGVGAIAYWSSRKSLASSEEYFLSGRSAGWLVIGASLFASNISTEHFIGLAGDGAKSGLAVGQFEWLACLILLLLGWLFVPFYQRLGVFTMPEFLETRYNAQCRTYLAVVSLLAYVFTKISVSLYAGALVLQILLGWNVWASAIVLLVATGVYTMFGGLRAVLYTDLFQAAVLIIGALVLTALAVGEAGGLGALVSATPADHFNLWKSSSNSDYPWTGILFGAPLLGIWYWCTDQMIVQRTLAARDVTQARRGTILAGYLKILPVFILVLPGVAGRVLFPAVNEAGQYDQIYPSLVERLLPVGLKGLVVASLLSALMSSLSSVFNSSSTLFVMDFYRKWRPEATERQLVRAGQVAVAALVLAGLAWLPAVARFGQLYKYLQSVQAYIAPPIAAVFLIGILWRRANGAGALAALLVGFVLGAFRFVLEQGNVASLSGPLRSFAEINFLHVAILLFVVSVATLVGVSLATAPPTQRNLSVFPATVQAQTGATASVAPPDRMAVSLSILLAALVGAFWIYFSPLFWKG